MIKALLLQGKTEDEIKDFVFKLSPYSDIKSEKFVSFWNMWWKGEQPRRPYMAQLKEMDKNTDIVLQRYFMVWTTFDNKKLFAGTEFIPENKAHTGLDLSVYESKAE